jgi:hypothetical protein
MVTQPTHTGRILALYLPLFILLGFVAVVATAPDGDALPTDAQMSKAFFAGALLALPLTALLYSPFERLASKLGLFSDARVPTMLRCGAGIVVAACLAANFFARGDYFFAALWLGLGALPIRRLVAHQ